MEVQNKVWDARGHLPPLLHHRQYVHLKDGLNNEQAEYFLKILARKFGQKNTKQSLFFWGRTEIYPCKFFHTVLFKNSFFYIL